MSIFGKKLSGLSGDKTGLVGVVAAVENMVAQEPASFQSSATATFGLENWNDSERSEMLGMESFLDRATEAVSAKAQQYGMKKPNAAQKAAAKIGAIMANNLDYTFKHFLPKPAVASESLHERVVPCAPGVSDVFSKRTLGVESYSEKDNKNAVSYTYAYNMNAARQDDFGEAHFETVVISPDNIGLAASVRVQSVQNDMRRDITGKLDPLVRQNILKAAVDYKILQDESTRVVPVVWDGGGVAGAPENKNIFVPTATIPWKTVTERDGSQFKTGALKLGVEVPLIQAAQRPALLKAGVMDLSDSLDPAIVLDGLYIKIGADVIRIATGALPYSAFSPAVQGHYRNMTLNMETKSILLNASTLTVLDTYATEAALAELYPAADPLFPGRPVGHDLQVQLSLTLSGSANCETGTTLVNPLNKLQVVSIKTKDGADAFTSAVAGVAAAATAIQTAISTATVEGMDIEAYLTNENRRQRGLLLDSAYWTQLFPVALRRPITVLRPVTADGQTDASDLAALINATHLACSNDAVTKLLKTSADLARYVDMRDVTSDGPDVLGIGRFLVRPTHFYRKLDITSSIQSLTSIDRPDAIASLIINQIRDFGYRMLADSNYQTAANAMVGGHAPAPTLVIGTDPVIARYLIKDGEMRLAGADLSHQVVFTQDARMRGKIVLTFRSSIPAEEGKANPLSFGNMAWKPEVTLVLPLARNGATNKELTVQPSYLHIVNLPVMAEIDVVGIPAVVADRVAVPTAVTQLAPGLVFDTHVIP